MLLEQHSSQCCAPGKRQGLVSYHLRRLRQLPESLDTGVRVPLAPYRPPLQQGVHRLSSSQSEKVDCLSKQLQQDIVYSTVGVGSEQHAFALTQETFDGLNNGAGLAGARHAKDQGVVWSGQNPAE